VKAIVILSAYRRQKGRVLTMPTSENSAQENLICLHITHLLGIQGALLLYGMGMHLLVMSLVPLAIKLLWNLPAIFLGKNGISQIYMPLAILREEMSLLTG
jgi:hypothetical protein